MKKSLYLIILCGLLTTDFAFAAHFQEEHHYVSEERVIEVTVLINTEGTPINAVEGSISYNPTDLKLVSITTNDSIISMWLKKPEVPSTLPQGLTTVPFSGGIIGSFLEVDDPLYKRTSPGTLFHLRFESKTGNPSPVTINNASVVMSDGLGTVQSVSDLSLLLRLSQTRESRLVSYIDQPVPHENKTKKIFFVNFDEENSQLLHFRAGPISPRYYEVAESDDDNSRAIPSFSWQRSTSPYLTTGSHRFVHIKAVDDDAGYSYYRVQNISLPQGASDKGTLGVILLYCGIFVTLIFIAAKKWAEHKENNR